MRLVTKLHDYYDGVARNTVSDRTHTFVREQRDTGEVDIEIMYLNDVECRTYDYNLTCEIVGFCGEIYPCIRIDKRLKVNKFDKPRETFYVYDLKSFKNIVPVDRIRSRWAHRRIFGDSGFAVPNIKSWFEHGREAGSWYKKNIRNMKTDPTLKKVFLKERIAYFHIDRVNRRANHIVHAYPILKDLQFYKVFDTYTCFQMIEHFLTNEIVKPDVIPQEIQDTITDELKAQAHGYDKMSFRKEPSKKKRKK